MSVLRITCYEKRKIISAKSLTKNRFKHYYLMRHEMSTIAEVTIRVLSLPSKSRAILADVLLDSLNDVEIINYDKLWIDEARRRDQEITAEKISCKTHSEVIKRARKVLMCK